MHLDIKRTVNLNETSNSITNASSRCLNDSFFSNESTDDNKFKQINQINSNLNYEVDCSIIEKQKQIKQPISVVNFYQTDLIHNRKHFCTQTQEIYEKYPECQTIALNEITDSSYFSVLWTPTKSVGYANNTSFLVFYRFRNKYLSDSVKFVPVIGCVSSKFEDEFWLTNQNLQIENNMNEFAFNKMHIAFY